MTLALAPAADHDPHPGSGSPGLRRLPARAFEPPYDDEPTTGPTGCPPGARTAAVAVQGSLALAFTLPSGLPAEPAVPAPLHLLPGSPVPAAVPEVSPADDNFFGPQRTPRHALAEPRPWAARLVQALVEVLAGERPAGQLLRWTDASVYATVQRQVRRRSAGSPRPVVRSVHVSEPADGVAEVCALVRRGRRTRALALRLEGIDGRWQCTALEVG